MKYISILILSILLFVSCKNNVNNEKTLNIKDTEYQHISNIKYEMYKPLTKPKALLILFGGYNETIVDIKREFKILDKAKENNIAVVYVNFNMKLWLEESDFNELSEIFQNILTENKLPKDNLYVGGFSSGGNIALLFGNYLTHNKKIQVKPKGIFIVDSPIDLVQLYQSSQKNIEHNFSQTSVKESRELIQTLNNRFGNPKDFISNYEKYSVFTLKTQHIDNLQNLQNTKIRLYTEPDTLWWKKNRKVEYEEMNAYAIKGLYEILIQKGYSKVEYIPTENRGYRANGYRHPHSWAIVETDNLIKWMLIN